MKSQCACSQLAEMKVVSKGTEERVGDQIPPQLSHRFPVDPQQNNVISLHPTSAREGVISYLTKSCEAGLSGMGEAHGCECDCRHSPAPMAFDFPSCSKSCLRAAGPTPGMLLGSGSAEQFAPLCPGSCQEP